MASRRKRARLAAFHMALRIANADRLNRGERPEPKGLREGQWRTRSGVLVSVMTREDAGVDADHPWIASCDTHSEMLGCETKRTAVASARRTADWCGGCREAAGSDA